MDQGKFVRKIRSWGDSLKHIKSHNTLFKKKKKKTNKMCRSNTQDQNTLYIEAINYTEHKT